MGLRLAWFGGWVPPGAVCSRPQRANHVRAAGMTGAGGAKNKDPAAGGTGQRRGPGRGRPERRRVSAVSRAKVGGAEWRDVGFHWGMLRTGRGGLAAPVPATRLQCPSDTGRRVAGANPVILAPSKGGNKRGQKKASPNRRWLYSREYGLSIPSINSFRRAETASKHHKRKEQRNEHTRNHRNR